MTTPETQAIEPATLRMVGVRDDAPVVCVKDRNIWARDSRTRDFYGVLSEATIEQVYEDVREDFWNFSAPHIAAEHGYSEKVYSAGRSSGWLQPSGPGLDFLEYLDADDPWTDDGGIDPADHDGGDTYVTAALGERDRFLRFAQAIIAAQESAGETFVQALRDAQAELIAARETAIVKGEN